ncbi:MAG TPA: histidine phosphatase family protein [Bacillales bacterium]
MIQSFGEGRQSILELFFIRHGQGIHNTNIPDRLNYSNPRLTEKGKEQVKRLHDTFYFKEEDVFLVSPTIRTIETANLLTSNLFHVTKFVHPLVGPRIFPLPENPKSHVSKCDEIYPITAIRKDHPDFIIQQEDHVNLWNEGINTMSQEAFDALGDELLSWVQSLKKERIFIVAHDGTITNYRILLGEEGLTRDDFLGEAGWHKVKL